ncbi:MAG: shikimate kinase [Acetivibrionales bacterium]|jgi:gluconate kinase
MGKRLIVLFGKTGAGKNYVSEIFAKELGFYFYDADRDLTAEMKEAVAEGRVFTVEMRDRYLEKIIERTKELFASHTQIVLAQGLFKNKQRRELLKAFPFAEFVWVDAADGLIEQRIVERNSSVTLEYALKINQMFEEPDFYCERIINHNSSEELLNKIRKIGANLGS